MSKTNVVPSITPMSSVITVTVNASTSKTWSFKLGAGEADELIAQLQEARKFVEDAKEIMKNGKRE